METESEQSVKEFIEKYINPYEEDAAQRARDALDNMGKVEDVNGEIESVLLSLCPLPPFLDTGADSIYCGIYSQINQDKLVDKLIQAYKADGGKNTVITEKAQ